MSCSRVVKVLGKVSKKDKFARFHRKKKYLNGPRPNYNRVHFTAAIVIVTCVALSSFHSIFFAAISLLSRYPRDKKKMMEKDKWKGVNVRENTGAYIMDVCV